MTAIRYLADVNVLLALLWPRHVHHEAAQKWFAAHGHRNWATNTIVQLGAIRLLTNPAITNGAVNPLTAVRVVAEATSHPNHQFWALDKTANSMLAGAEILVKGYRQWTDLFLLRHAVDRKGKLVTFDKGMAEVGAIAGAPPDSSGVKRSEPERPLRGRFPWHRPEMSHLFAPMDGRRLVGRPEKGFDRYSLLK